MRAQAADFFTSHDDHSELRTQDNAVLDAKKIFEEKINRVQRRCIALPKSLTSKLLVEIANLQVRVLLRCYLRPSIFLPLP